MKMKKGNAGMIVIVIIGMLVLLVGGVTYLMFTPMIEQTHEKTIDKIENEDYKDTANTIKNAWDNWPGLIIIGVVLFIIIGAFKLNQNNYPYQ